MTNLRHIGILLVVALALGLCACKGDSSGAPAAAEPEPAAQATKASTPEPRTTAADEPDATESAVGPPPTFRNELEATDPLTVALGAGRPQAIEFFAHW